MAEMVQKVGVDRPQGFHFQRFTMSLIGDSIVHFIGLIDQSVGLKILPNKPHQLKLMVNYINHIRRVISFPRLASYLRVISAHRPL